MKTKDIVLVVICALVIAGSIYFAVSFLTPKKQTNTNTNTNNEVTFTGEIDEKTLDVVKKWNDYGEATLENIGRVNPFGPIN